MDPQEIINLRLQNQLLLKPDSRSDPQRIVRYSGPIQSQDFNGAKWSLALRLKNTTSQNIQDVFDGGKILRTHIMRPTWHFVSPEDIGWLLKLTAPRVKMLLANYDRSLEINPQLIEKVENIFSKNLVGDRFLSRKKLADLLLRSKIKASGQRLGHLLIHAELDRVLTSGPKFGNNFTYALFEERVKKIKDPTPNQALELLTLKYFSGHGPAQIKDFSWWSGLTLNQAKEGINLNIKKLTSVTLADREYWLLKNNPKTTSSDKSALLTSVYDEYFIGYKDRSLILTQDYKKNIARVGNALLTSLLIIGGKVEGTWKRTLLKDILEIKINSFRKLSLKEKAAILREAEKYSLFFGHKISNLLFM